MHSAFNQSAAFSQDAADNKPLAGQARYAGAGARRDHSFGAQMGDIMRLVASGVTIDATKDLGHRVMEEQPVETTAMIKAFIDKG
jgi:hypothetical protein